MFKTFFVVRQSGSITVVDAFSSKRHPVARMYINVTKASLNRLRAAWRANNASVAVIRGAFSPARMVAVRSAVEASRKPAVGLSLDHLQTSGRHA